MDSQATCDRIKQVCVDNGLPLGDKSNIDFDFDFSNKVEFNALYFSKRCNVFAIAWEKPNNLTQVTEQEFLQLLKEYKDGQ